MTDGNRLLVAAAAIAIGLCAAPFALQGNRGAPGFDADAVRGDVHAGAASGGFASGEGATQAGTSGPARSGFTDTDAESRHASSPGATVAASGEAPTDVPAGMTQLNATVVFEDGAPVGPAFVTPAPVGENPSAQEWAPFLALDVTQDAALDADGRAALLVPTGLSFVLAVEVEEYGSTFETRPAVVAGDDARCVLPCRRLRVQVRWENGSPGAGVVFRAAGAEARTDVEGFVAMRVPGEPSTVVLCDFNVVDGGVSRGALVKTDAGPRRDVTVKVSEAETAEIVTLQKAVRVKGCIVDAAGRPVPGADCQLRFGRAGQDVLSWGPSCDVDAEGRFSVELPPSFDQHVTVWGIDVFSPYNDATTEVRRNGVPRDGLDLGNITLAVEGWILVRVQQPSGAPASGAVLEATIVTEADAASAPSEAGAGAAGFDEARSLSLSPPSTSENSGEFLFCVGRGPWRVIATDDAGGYAEATSRGGGASSTSPRIVSLTLKPTRGTLRFTRPHMGLVYQVDDGNTVTDADVVGRDEGTLTVPSGVPLRIRADRAWTRDSLRDVGFPCDCRLGSSWGPTLEIAPLAPGETRRIRPLAPGPRRPLAIKVQAHDGSLARGAAVALLLGGQWTGDLSRGAEFIVAIPPGSVTVRAQWAGVAAEAFVPSDVDSVVLKMPKTRRAYLALRMPEGAGGVWATASVGNRAVEVHSFFKDGWFYAVTQVGVDDAVTFVLDACGRTSRHTAPPGTECVDVETPPHGWARFEAVSPIPKGLPGLLEVRRAGTDEVVHDQAFPPGDGSLLLRLPPLPLAQGSFVATLRFREPEDGGWMSLLPPRPVEIVEGSTVVVAF